MKIKLIFHSLVTIFFSITCHSLHSQELTSCDTIYECTEIMPKYGEKESDILLYFSKELAPIISKCTTETSELYWTFVFKLIINKNGEVIEVEIIKPKELPIQYQNDLKEKLLTMTGWKPGQMNGQKVCTYFRLPIRVDWD